MPQYCYAIVDGDVVREGDSLELPGLDAARKTATAYVSDLVRELDGSLFDHALELRVTDHQGLLLFLVTVIASEAPAIRY